MILPTEYFLSDDTPQLAYNLIGKYLCRTIANQTQAYLITEVEAYHGNSDKANHARFGKTKRNAIMFATGGYWYVYLCYGVHWLLNIVTGAKDNPSAILIRGIIGAQGPGRLTRLLQIDQSFNQSLCALSSGLWLEDRGIQVKHIKALPRVGINYAQEYRDKPWRFVLDEGI